MASRSRTGRSAGIAPYIAAALPLLAGATLPHSPGWSWGWDHAHRLGPLAAAVFIALASAVLLPPVRRAILGGATRLGGAMERSPERVALAAALCALAAFAAFPIATRIYGDSRYILDDHAATGMATHWRRLASFGVQSRGSAVFLLHDLIEKATGLSYERSFQLVSTLCGAIFVFAHARFAGRLRGVAGWARWTILWIGLTDGANQLFFGHVEIYTVPRLFACLFLMRVTGDLLARDPSMARRAEHRGVGGALACLALALVFHGQVVVLLPAFALWMLVRRDAQGTDRPASAWLRGRVLFAGLGGAVAAIAVLYVLLGAGCYDYIYSGGRPHPKQVLLPLTTACVGAPYLRYTLFSAGHLLDWAGSLYSISSGAILLAWILLAAGARRDRGFLILAAAALAAALHNFVLNPAIGFPFDWDMLSVISPPLLYGAVYLVARAGGHAERTNGAEAQAAVDSGGFLASGALALGLASVALFAVNADGALVRRRVDDMGVWLHRTYYGGSHYRLSANASTVTDPSAQAAVRAETLRRLAPQTYPDDREVAFLWEKLALLQIEQEDYGSALVSYRAALAAQPSRRDRKKPVGYLESEVGDLNEGIRLLSEYMRDNQADAEGWLFLGDACARAGIADVARRSWTRYLELAPDSPEAQRVRADLQKIE